VKVAGKEIGLEPGKIVVLPPRTVYSTRTESGVLHLYMHFSVERPYSEFQPGMYVFTSERLLSLAASIAHDLRDRKPRAKTLLKAEIYLCEILLSLPDHVEPSEKVLDPRIAKALEILDMLPLLSNLELACKLGMSRTSFSELFHRETSLTPQSYSRRKRLERACVMLHCGNNPIKTIAAETGFCDRYHFERAFKREFDVTPAKYRKQARPVKTLDV